MNTILALLVSAGLQLSDLDNKALWDLYVKQCVGNQRAPICLNIRKEAFRRNQTMRDHENRIERWQEIHTGKIKEL